MNEIKIKNLNGQYSEITVKEIFNNGALDAYRITKHIISNCGWFDLDYWINYFTNEF